MTKLTKSKYQKLVLCEHGAKRVPYEVQTRVRIDGTFKETYVVIAPCMFGYHYLAPKLAVYPDPERPGVFTGADVIVEKFAREIDDVHQWSSEREAHAAVAAWDAMMARRTRESDASDESPTDAER